MDRRNDPDPAAPGTPGPPPPRSPWGGASGTRPARDPWNAAWRRPARQDDASLSPTDQTPALRQPGTGGLDAPLSTPLVWAGGGLLLTFTFWLASAIALFRAFGSLFH